MSFNLEQANGGTFCLSKVGLTVGTTPTGFGTAAAANYVIDGVFKAAVAADADVAIAAAAGFELATVPVGSKAAFGVWLDGAGAFYVTQGAVAAVNSNSDKAGPPPAPASMALVGVFTIYAATAAFVPGTTNLSDAGVVDTYFDTFSLPSRGF